MFLTTHAMLGALVAEAAPEPISAFIFGFASHFLIDMIPHGDSRLYNNYQSRIKRAHSLAYVTIDSVIGIVLVAWLYSTIPTSNLLIRTMGIMGGVLPDLLVGLGELYKTVALKKYTALHFYFHNFFIRRYRDIKLSNGIMLQMMILIVLIKTLI